MIVDTHVHVLGADRKKYPRQLREVITPNFAWTRDDYTSENLLSDMDRGGMAKALLVQAQNAYGSDNSYVVDMAMKYPDRFKAVCVVDARDADAADQLERWVSERGAIGGRMMFQTADFQVDDERANPVLQRARTLGVPMCLYVWWKELARFERVLQLYPDQVIALDHMGHPNLEDGTPYSNARALLLLARYPNLILKFSTTTLLAASKGTSTSRDWFSSLINAYGSKRLMWGSNYPMNHEHAVPGLIEFARHELSFLPATDFDNLMGNTALSVYPWLQ
jgi:L-fuconolactonase